MGEVTFIPAFMGSPVELEIIGLLRYGGKALNMAGFALPHISEQPLPPLILVAGTSSEIGKTTLASKIIHILEAGRGLRVSSVMLSGTGSKADALEHRAAGASFFHSFIELGFCNTYRCDRSTFLAGIRNLLYWIAREERPDIIVGELGGDFVWGHNDDILTDPRIMQHAIKLLVVINDVVGAIGTLEIFRAWKLNVPVAFAGSWQRSHGGMRLRFEKLLNRPLLDIGNWGQIEKLIDDLPVGHFDAKIVQAC